MLTIARQRRAALLREIGRLDGFIAMAEGLRRDAPGRPGGDGSPAEGGASAAAPRAPQGGTGPART